MSDVLVYAVESRAASARALLGAACAATGVGARLELYGTGSLYQRLGPRRAAPFPDIVMWFGPFAAHAAALDGLVQAHTPAAMPEGAPHDPDWKWTTLEYSAIGVVGTPPVAEWSDLDAVPRLALADPERSEVGLNIVLASLDRERQIDPERGWAWWQQRAEKGLALADDDASAVALVGAGPDPGTVSHALTLATDSTPLGGIAPLPHALSLAANSRNLDDARRVLDWLTSPAAAGTLRLSPWQPGANGLAALLASAPPIDIAWAHQRYTAARRRWAQSGFGPTIAG